MEKINKQEHSELFKKIYNLVSQIPRKEVNSDAPDSSSISFEIEKLFYEDLENNFKKMILSAYKDGFKSALISLQSAYDAVDKKEINQK